MEGVDVEWLQDGVQAYRWFDEYWRDEQRLPFLIEESGTVVGFRLIRAMDDGWNVAEFAIRAEWRRRGLGRESVDALASAAKSAGAGHLRADVHEWNDLALRFWTSCWVSCAGHGHGRRGFDAGLLSRRRNVVSLGCAPVRGNTPRSLGLLLRDGRGEN